MRWVSSAVWTSGEPVSPSPVAYSEMIACLVAESKAILVLLRSLRGAPGPSAPGSSDERPPSAPHPCGWTVAGGGIALRGRYDGSGRISGAQVAPGALRLESAAGHLDVLGHLLHERVDRVELQRGALELDELQAHGVAVEVEVVVAQHVGLDGAAGRAIGLEGGVGADGDRRRGAGQRLVARVRGVLGGDRRIAGVDAVGGDQALRPRAQVRRGEAELAPAAEA